MPGLAGTVQVPRKFVLLGFPKATTLGADDSNNDNMLTVDDLQVNQPVRFVGLAGAKVGDHVHLIPQGRDWKVRLCLPRGKTTLLRVSDHGAVERVELEQK